MNEGGGGGPRGCLCVVYGVPGAGKTVLTDSLVAAARQEETGKNLNVAVIHFDNMYPLDLRASSTEPQRPTEAPFALKASRESINACLEHYVSLHLSAPPPSSSSSPPPERWEEFLSSVSEACPPSAPSPPLAVLIDDNLPLRSMRLNYYHLARKYCLGFAEVCITCSLATALQRNSSRPVPIPDPTIIDMERRLELPDPLQYHWEERNVILTNSHAEMDTFIAAAKDAVYPLLWSAITHPVPPTVPQADWQLQESSRCATLDSLVHQADVALRKCVSQCLAEAGADQDRAALAGLANTTRRRLLGEVRRGRVEGVDLTTSGLSARGTHLSEAIQSMFASAMRNANEQTM